MRTRRAFETRPRRLRRMPGLRRLARETELSPSDLIYPVFVQEGEGEPIPSMPGQSRLSIDELAGVADELLDLGIPAILLFGLPDRKDDEASSAYDDGGIVQRAIRELKAKAPELVVMTDVCVCGYTPHGHCGVLREDGEIDNDASLELLARMAVSHADAGADVLAPSAMMDHQVEAIREALDGTGLANAAIMSYAAKYASAFYGPFRDAAESAPAAGDRRGYQMDPPNVREAVREIELDLDEGADMVMVKPALAYLDVIHAASEVSNVPVAAYNVSGEYSMIKATAERGWIDETAAVLEALTAMRRAGSDMILTYFAKDAARALRERS
ncbi:MAG: porphobilinogen synthase [Candidatus Bipolaricaulia bacterium]